MRRCGLFHRRGWNVEMPLEAILRTLTCNPHHQRRDAINRIAVGFVERLHGGNPLSLHHADTCAALDKCGLDRGRRCRLVAGQLRFDVLRDRLFGIDDALADFASERPFASSPPTCKGVFAHAKIGRDCGGFKKYGEGHGLHL